MQVLDRTQNEKTRRLAAESLGKIDPGNPKAIEVLTELLETTQDELTRWQAAVSLEKIDPGNPKVIEALIQLLDRTQDELTRWQAAVSLEKIDPGNPKVIEALIQLLDRTQDELTRWRAAGSLGKIGTGNPKAIEALIQVLQTTQDEFTRRRAAESLGKIGTDNPKVIEALIELLDTSRKVPARQQAVAILEKIGIGNPKAIAGLRNLQHHRNPYTRLLVTKLLPKITALPQSQAQQIEDDLLLFLQETRVKNTVDRYFSTNNPQKAKFCYHRIIACLDKLQEGRDIITRRSLLNSYLDIYQRIVYFSIKTGDLNRAFFYTELFRNRYLVERIAQHYAPLPNTVTPELSAQINQAKVTEKKRLQDYTNGINQNLDEQQLKQLEIRWEEAKKALETLYAQVAVIEPEFIAKTKVSPLSFRQIQSVLPSNTAILEFFFTANKLLTLLILPGAKSPEYIPVKLNPKSIAALAQTWVSNITAKTPSNKKEDEDIDATIQTISEQINQISDSLNLSTLLPHIPAQIQHLIIVPHKYLHLFPLHALWLNDHQRLIERFAVSYFPNLQTWKICQNRQRSRHSLMGIENPTQDKDLIFAKAEMASISQRQQFSHRKIFPGKQASKAEILNSATDTHCFHFSGHAEYNFQNPLDSYLMLSANSEENLTLNTIFADLHIPQADLVTLSACCTGVVDAFQPIEEYLGLPTGFLLAGAKAVIGSQWKVNSIATAFIFDEFYRQLEQTGNKAIALKNAQNWLRRCTDDELRERANTWDLSKLEITERIRLDAALYSLEGIPFENPYYWAAFILTGC
ncbi:CHAT domain-containing protein [Coleofasciculus chthonoplastes]|uniref:CHAT domain-containing protein n=1 Tax=Coleofasciculus chthonoplastes TaxID=64178 RepID=UPI0040648B34